MTGRRPRIGILTSLTDFSLGYSLINVILAQARMLKRHGYEYDLLCHRAFNPQDMKEMESQGLSIRYVLPQTKLHKYRTDEPPRPTTERSYDGLGFDDQVKAHLEGDGHGTLGFYEALSRYDVVITHDLMFQEDFLVQNQAIRACIDRWPEKRWLHWVHSRASLAPDGTCYPSTLRYTAAPNSVYVYLNETDRHICALMLETTRDNIAVVYNSMDVRDVYEFSEESKHLVDRYDLLNHDLLQVYAFSTPRWLSKGVRQLLRLCMHWKDQGIRAKLVLVNCHCNSDVDQPKLRAIERWVQRAGLEIDRDVVMTSRFADEVGLSQWKYSVPARVVRDLNLCANLFVFPSESECCSLIQAEASISGKFMVLNEEFPPMREFCHESALMFDFKTNDPDDFSHNYYECVAREVWDEFRSDHVAMNSTAAKTRTCNRDWIFKNQLEPLLWRGFSGKLTAAACPREMDEETRPEDQLTKKTEINEPPAVEKNQSRQAPQEPDYSDPKPGDPCPIYGECSADLRERCYAEAGHCLNLDEVLA